MYAERANAFVGPKRITALCAYVASSVDTLLPPGDGGCRITVLDAQQRLAIFDKLPSDAVPEGQWERAMIVALYPSQQIPAHVDAPIVGTRYHLPIRTNDRCWVMHDSAWHRLEVGHVYRMDPTELHGAVNWGADVRWHLAVDILETP